MGDKVAASVRNASADAPDIARTQRLDPVGVLAHACEKVGAVSTFDELPERLRRSLTAAAITLGVQVADLYEAITTYGRSNGAAIASSPRRQ